MNLSIEDKATCVRSALFFIMETKTLRSFRVCYQIKKRAEVFHRIHSLQIREDADAFMKGLERSGEWCFRLHDYRPNNKCIPRWESPCRIVEQTYTGCLASFARGSR